MFERMRELSRLVWERHGRTYGIDLLDLAQDVFIFMTTRCGTDPQQAALTLAQDLEIPKVRPIPLFLRPFLTEPARRKNRRAKLPTEGPTPKRQKRFVQNSQK